MENSNRPILYSKTSLIAFSFFSCFFSGLLYVQNLRELGKTKFVLPMVLYSILFPTILNKVLASTGIPLYYSYIPINLLGGILLINPFWNYQIAIDDYKNRNITIPAIAILALFGFFIAFALLRK